MSMGTAELQETVAVATAQPIASAWERAIASYEVEDRDDGRVENIIVVYVRRDGDHFSTAGLEHTPGSIEAAFFALHEASVGCNALWHCTTIGTPRGDRTFGTANPPLVSNVPR